MTVQVRPPSVERYSPSFDSGNDRLAVNVQAGDRFVRQGRHGGIFYEIEVAGAFVDGHQRLDINAFR